MRASLIEWQPRMVINYLVCDERGGRVARAQTTQVAVRADNKELQLVMPACFTDRVGAYIGRLPGHGGVAS